MVDQDKSKLKEGLSKEETLLLAELSSRGKRFIHIEDIEEALECSYDNARRIASDLTKKKWLERVGKGKYLIVPLEAGQKGLYTEHEFIMASELVDPYYIGYWSALNFHGMTEQVPLTVFVATTKRKKFLNLHGVDYKFVTLTKKKFFGIKKYAIGDSKVEISSPEKTLVDSLDHLEYSGGFEEVSKAIKTAGNEISKEKLVDYAIRLKNGSVLKRLLYLVDKLNIELPKELKEKIRQNFTTGYALLDPTKKDMGRYKRKWRVKINVPEDKIIAWSENR